MNRLTRITTMATIALIVLAWGCAGPYTGTWRNRQVAGSTGAGSTDMAGTVVVHGVHVTLVDWRRLILKREGNVLYGLTIDPGTGRTLSVQLEKVS